MKGYKATYNMKCLTLTYEVGKTYEIDSYYRFHFCERMEDVLEYYNYKSDFVLLEVEALGDVETDGNKSVTNKLKVLRIVPKEEYIFKIPEKCKEYDPENNLIHCKDSNGDEYWEEYNEYWKEYIFKIPEKSKEYILKLPEEYREYDSQNNLVHYKDLNGHEYWKEYDSENNLIRYKNSVGREWNIIIK